MRGRVVKEKQVITEGPEMGLIYHLRSEGSYPFGTHSIRNKVSQCESNPPSFFLQILKKPALVGAQ